MKVILEYSEQQQAFHNNTGEKGENTNGYKTLGQVSEDDSYIFVKYVRNNAFGANPTTYNEIKELFDNIF